MLPEGLRRKKSMQRQGHNRIGARLLQFASRWSFLPPRMTIFLKRGYHWEWSGAPPALKQPRLLKQSLRVQEQVQTLLDQGAIYEVNPQPCILSRVFVVPKFPTGSRLILDVSDLNQHIVIPSFKMTNHRSLASLLQPPAWVASLDLKDAYLHIPMRKNLHKFLALTCWGRLFFFRALPFGLAPAPWLFSALMEHALGELRKEGVQVLGYIDDLIFWHQDKAILSHQVSRAMLFLESLGLTINRLKSQPSPVSSLTWLGIVWQAQIGTWCPQTKLLEDIQDLAINLETCTKGVEEILGKTCRESSICRASKQKSKTLLAQSIPSRPLCTQRAKGCTSSDSKTAQRGTSKVDQGHKLGTTRKLHKPPSDSPMLVRRLRPRVGRSGTGGPAVSGRLVNRREPPPYKRARNAHGFESCESSGHRKLKASSVDRQCSRDKCGEQTRIPLQRSPSCGKASHGGNSQSQHSANASPHRRQKERGCRRSVKSSCGRWRMGAVGTGLRKSSRIAWKSASSGSVCITNKQQTSEVCISLSAPESVSNGRPDRGLEQLQADILVPANRTRSKSSSKTTLLCRRRHSGSKGLRIPQSPSTSQVQAETPSLAGSTPANNSRSGTLCIEHIRTLSRLQFLKRAYCNLYSEEVADNLLEATADSSNRQYESNWRAFATWLPKDATSIDRALVMSYLSKLGRTLAPRTVLVHRNALRLPLELAFNVDFDHKHFGLLAKAHFRRAPPEKQLLPSWSLEDLLLKNRMFDKTDQRSVFLKTIFLAAIASANRAAELAAIERKSISLRSTNAILGVKAGFLLKDQSLIMHPHL